MNVLAKADEFDPGSIEARLNRQLMKSFVIECAVKLRRGGNKGLSLLTLLSEQVIWPCFARSEI
jgi:hypothetical protein